MAEDTFIYEKAAIKEWIKKAGKYSNPDPDPDASWPLLNRVSSRRWQGSPCARPRRTCRWGRA
jgi:hypothetical protein